VAVSRTGTCGWFTLRIAPPSQLVAWCRPVGCAVNWRKAHRRPEISVEAMATQGDRFSDVALAKIGGTRACYTRNWGPDVLDRLNIAVHSSRTCPRTC